MAGMRTEVPEHLWRPCPADRLQAPGERTRDGNACPILADPKRHLAPDSMGRWRPLRGDLSRAASAATTGLDAELVEAPEHHESGFVEPYSLDEGERSPG